MNNEVFEKTVQNVRKHIKLVITKRRRKYLVSEPKNNKVFYRKLIATEMRNFQILINEPVYLG